MIGSFQKINMMNNSITGEELYIMINSVHIPSRIKQGHRRHASSIQDLTILMVFLEKESQRYPSSTTRINDVSI